MESRNMTEKEFEEFQKLLARELGAVDSDRDREEEKLITEMLRHEGAAHEAARTAANAVREFAVKRAAEEKSAFNIENSGDSDVAYPYREITEKTARNDWIENLKKYQKIKELTPEIIDSLIDTIYVHEDNKITIKFNYEDEYKTAIEYVKANNGIEISSVG